MVLRYEAHDELALSLRKEGEPVVVVSGQQSLVSVAAGQDILYR